MKKNKIQDRFIKELELMPIIQRACAKVNIVRKTYYEWRKKDPDFARRADEALFYGEAVVNDIAEGNVLNGIKNGDPGYTKLWLNSRHPKYKKSFAPIKDPVDPEIGRLSEERIKSVNEFLDMWTKPTPPKKVC